MENIEKINIANDFSPKLGARYIYEGDWSGELFLSNLLIPKFEKAISAGGKLVIELDGVIGYPSSFISGSFGKLSLEKGAEVVLKHIEFKSTSELRIEKITLEIKNPKKK